VGESRQRLRCEGRLSTTVADDNEADAPPSPCVRNCCLDLDDVCLGCNRTLQEICGWHKASAAEKTEILRRCRSRSEERRERLQKRDWT
jgi:predicted Fe-S protein YdhL (DUF1289 family)